MLHARARRFALLISLSLVCCDLAWARPLLQADQTSNDLPESWDVDNLGVRSFQVMQQTRQLAS